MTDIAPTPGRIRLHLTVFVQDNSGENRRTFVTAGELAMRLRYTILYVNDVRESLDFYRNAFGLEARFIHESGDYGELDTGATALAFSSRRLMRTLGKEPGRPDPQAPVFEVAFEVDDVATSFSKAVRAGAKVSQAPRDEPWGQTTSYVEDPDGYLIEICSPVRSQQ